MGEAVKKRWHMQRIKRLVRDRVVGGNQCIVSVRETFCADPECQGLATEIRIVTLTFHEIRAIVHKELSEVTDLDIATCL